MQVTALSVDLLIEPLIVVRENLETPDFLELVNDIRAHGVEIPIIVRPVDGKYRVVDGFRRWRAALAAHLLEVPCEVRDMDDAEEIALLMRVALHRADFTPLEEGKMFATMHEGSHLTFPGIAKEVGKSVAYVTDRIAVVMGPLDIRQALAAGEINLTVAHELLRVTHEGDRAYLLHWARTQGASAATVRLWIQERLQARAAQPESPPPATPQEAFGTPPVTMGICGWHRGPAPMNSIISLQVCRACYGQLEVIRQRLEAAGQEENGEVADVPRA